MGAALPLNLLAFYTRFACFLRAVGKGALGQIVDSGIHFWGLTKRKNCQRSAAGMLRIVSICKFL
jgi:hypothetical protein